MSTGLPATVKRPSARSDRRNAAQFWETAGGRPPPRAPRWTL